MIRSGNARAVASLAIISMLSVVLAGLTFGGTTVTQVRDDIYLVNVLARARDAERGSIETLQNLQLMAGNGKAIPREQGYSLESW